MGIYRRAAARPALSRLLLKPEIFTTVERWVGIGNREIHPGRDDGGGLLFPDGE